MIEINKIYNEDCLQGMLRLDDKSVDLILCDLPYGTTECNWDVIIPFEPLWKQYNRIIKDNAAIVLFGSEPFSTYLRISNIKNFKYDWIWNKKKCGNPFLAKYQPMKIHEMISVFNKHKYYPIQNKKVHGKFGNSIANFKTINASVKCKIKNDSENGYPQSIIDIRSIINFDKEFGLHPTQKPVKLFEYLIKTYTNENELVLDNCMGSGTTAIACLNTNRNYVGFELDTNYFNIAQERIKTHIIANELDIEGLF